MRILVTGGLGFVGINLVRFLAQTLDHATVIAVDLGAPDDRASAFLAPVAERVRTARLEITNRAAVLELVQQHTVTHIVHAAAITPGAEQERQSPTLIVDVNLAGAINVLEATVAAPTVVRTLLLSSSGLYGAPTAPALPPEREDGPLQLDNLYAITKRSAELLGARYAELCGKSIVSARLAAPYGALERPTGSRAHMSQVQRLAEAVLYDRSVTVAGPEIVRDWTYVDDTAAALRALLLAPALEQPVYNVSAGQAILFRDVVDAFVAHGLRAEWVADGEQATVAMRPHQQRAPLDIHALRGATGFVPYFDLQSGVAAYLAAERALRAAPSITA